jgi:hypothetical protein
MTTFMIEFDFERYHYECFVQKIKTRNENYYILNFKDSELIKRMQCKRMVLSQHTSVAINTGDDLLRAQAWNAIAKREDSSKPV